MNIHDYSLIAHSIPSLKRYLLDGIPPGGFLRAVLSNNLEDAVGRADEQNQPLLPVYVSYMYNKMPAGTHGSYENYKSVTGSGGMNGKLYGEYSGITWVWSDDELRPVPGVATSTQKEHTNES